MSILVAERPKDVALPPGSEKTLWCRGCKGTSLSYIGEKNGFGILRCETCRTAMVDRYPSNEELIAFYSNYHKTGNYQKKAATKIRRGAGRIRRMMALKPPGKRFLDVGCNAGYVVEAARQLGLEAHGIDIDAGSVQAAKDAYKATFEVIPVEERAKRGDKFDMIYTSEVLEHVRDPDGFIAAIGQLLSPRGVLYVTAPDGAHFRTPKDFLSWDKVFPPEHLTYFSRKGVTALLARHGFAVEKFQIAFKPGLKLFARSAATVIFTPPA
jgi:SAM-dependent methyltransferase